MIKSKKELNLINKLNRGIAVFALPFIGMGIPAITGLITYHVYTLFELALIHMFFSALAYVIWYINVLFFKRIRITEIGHGSDQNLKTGILFICLNIVTSGIVSYLSILAFLFFSKEKDTDGMTIFMTCTLSIISAVTLGLLYEYFLLQLKWKILSLSKKKITKANLQAEIASLEPHFLFNALGTLSALISTEHQEAKKYNLMLSQTYHYILHKKNLSEVTLKEEFSFMMQYLEMMDYVYPDKIKLINKMEFEDLTIHSITPISLQLLIENAIKHNSFSTENPLLITIEKVNHYVIVRNVFKEKKTSIQISGTGLKNLNDRCLFFSGKSISIIQTQTEFLVQVPIKSINP